MAVTSPVSPTLRNPPVRSVAIGATAVTILAGLTTLLGWWLGIEPLKRGIGDGVAMNPATAITFVLAGAALWLLRREPVTARDRRVAFTLAAAVASIAIIRLAGYLLGAEVGIDQLLFHDRLIDVIAGRPNRMAPNTAVCFLIIGAALVLLDVETRRGHRPAQFLSFTSGVIAILALVGYAYSALSLDRTAAFIPMAFNTAGAFLLLSSGVIAARPGRGLLASLARWSLRRRVNVGFGIALGVLLLGGAASVWGNFRASAAAAERTAANQRRIELLRLQSLMEEAIRGERGYLLTGDSLFLRPYIDARDSLPSALRSAAAAFVQVPEAAERFGTLGPMVQGAMAFFAQTIAFDRAGNRAAATRMVRQGRGKVLMDGIRDTIGRLVAEDEARAARLDVSARGADRLAVVTSAGAGLLAVVLLFGAMLTINRDISKREQAEAALRESEARLAIQYQRLNELERLRDSLVHMLVHDLRSPLTAIRAYLELIRLQAEKGVSADLSESIDQADAAAAGMTEMVSDLIDVSRFEAGVMPLTRAEVDLTELTAEAMALVGVGLHRVPVTFEPPLQPMRVVCDPGLVRRVIANLVANAIKFTPENGQVRIHLSTDQNGVQVSVSDTGYGIAAEHQDKIFEKFGQVEASRQGAKRSSGLGLTFCKLAVEAHGGEIGVDSKVGKGSTFWFTLPVHG
jgi:signal transduction histidine kinase